MYDLLTGKLCRRLLLCTTAALSSTIAYADTPAGDRITNTAAVTYLVDGIAQSGTSNTVETIVAERLDVALVRTTTGTVSATAGAIPMLLTNGGNGTEAFRLTAQDDSAASPTQFAIDVDGNGQYDATRDTLLSDAVTPSLAPGATLALLLLGDSTGAATGGFDGTQVTIVAQAVTGFGMPGTAFDGRGDGGGDAVVGPTGAQAQVVVPTAAATQPTLAKTQTVLAPDGSDRPVRGAVITYTLSATFPGAATAARIDDPVPAGTSYVPGSLQLDGQSLSDAADADAGTAGPTSVGVALGDIAAAGVRTLQFQVLIQ